MNSTNSGIETWTTLDNVNGVIACGVEAVGEIAGGVGAAVEGILKEVGAEDSIVGDTGCRDHPHRVREMTETRTVGHLPREIPTCQQAELDVAETTPVTELHPPDRHRYPRLCLVRPGHDVAVPPHHDLELHRDDDFDLVVDLIPLSGVREDMEVEGGAGRLIAAHVEDLQTLLLQGLPDRTSGGDHHQAVARRPLDPVTSAVVEI